MNRVHMSYIIGYIEEDDLYYCDLIDDDGNLRVSWVLSSRQYNDFIENLIKLRSDVGN